MAKVRVCRCEQLTGGLHCSSVQLEKFDSVDNQLGTPVLARDLTPGNSRKILKQVIKQRIFPKT